MVAFIHDNGKFEKRAFHRCSVSSETGPHSRCKSNQSSVCRVNKLIIDLNKNVDYNQSVYQDKQINNKRSLYNGKGLLIY
jgi:hypothetical protein